MICWSAWSSSATRIRIAISLSPDPPGGVAFALRSVARSRAFLGIAAHQSECQHGTGLHGAPRQRLEIGRHRTGPKHREAPIVEPEHLGQHLCADATTVASNAIDHEGK